MPTYAYHCTVCQHQVDLFQKITDPVEKVCPQCGHEALRRGPGGGIGLSFVGSGFYQTDYTARPKEGNSCPCGKSDRCNNMERKNSTE